MRCSGRPRTSAAQRLKMGARCRQGPARDFFLRCRLRPGHEVSARQIPRRPSLAATRRGRRRYRHCGRRCQGAAARAASPPGHLHDQNIRARGRASRVHLRAGSTIGGSPTEACGKRRVRTLRRTAGKLGDRFKHLPARRVLVQRALVRRGQVRQKPPCGLADDPRRVPGTALRSPSVDHPHDKAGGGPAAPRSLPRLVRAGSAVFLTVGAVLSARNHIRGEHPAARRRGGRHLPPAVGTRLAASTQHSC